MHHMFDIVRLDEIIVWS